MRLAALSLALALAPLLAAADPPATVPDTGPDQISQPSGAATGADQVSAAPANTTGARQITSPKPDASAAQATRRTSDTSAPALAGSDRCDPAATTARRPECANILDARGDELATAPKTAPTTIVSPDTGSSALVNGILSGGTGDVVQLPP